MWIKAVVAINIIALLGFLVAAAAAIVFSDLDVRMRFTQLDRAGVINNDALDQFHASYGFRKGAGYRSTVPRFISEVPLRREQRNAICGAILAVVNCTCAACAWIVSRRKRSGVASKNNT